MTIRGLTKRQIRQQVGWNLAGSRFHVSTTSSSCCDATSVIDTNLRGGDDEYLGWWIRANSGDNEDEVRRGDDYCACNNDITVKPAFSNTVPACMSFEAWPPEYPPAMIDEFLDQGVIAVTGITYDPVEDISIHLHPDCLRYDIPSCFSMINALEEREHVCTRVGHTADAAWTSDCSCNVTVATDTEIKREGNAANKLTIAAGFTTGNAAHVCICDQDFSRYDTLEFWVRATCTLGATAVDVLLQSCCGCTTQETLSMPAISTACQWEFKRISLANPQCDTAIDRITVQFDCDPGAICFWIDDVKAVKTDTARWEPISSRRWYVEHCSQDLIFKSEPRYRLLKIRGGDNPALFPDDNTTGSEIDEAYLVAYTTWRALAANPDASQTEIRAAREQLEFAKGGIRPSHNVRRV